MCDLALLHSYLPPSCHCSQTSGSSTTSTSPSRLVTLKRYLCSNTMSRCSGSRRCKSVMSANDGNKRSVSVASMKSMRNAIATNTRNARHERLTSRWDRRRGRGLHARRCAGGRYVQDAHNGNAIGALNRMFLSCSVQQWTRKRSPHAHVASKGARSAPQEGEQPRPACSVARSKANVAWSTSTLPCPQCQPRPANGHALGRPGH